MDFFGQSCSFVFQRRLGVPRPPMQYPFDWTTIVLAILAAFVVWKLRSVLAARSGAEAEKITEDTDRRRRQELALTTEYFRHQIKNAVVAMSFLVPIAFFVSTIMHDYSFLFLALVYCAITVAFLTFTHYRSRHGYFGSTAAEAAELIEFIATETSKGNPPQSRKVSPLLDRVETRVRELAGNAVQEKG